jgi:hypothetical protein
MDWSQVIITILGSGIFIKLLDLALDFFSKNKRTKYSASLLSHHLLDYAQKCVCSIENAIEANKEVDIEENQLGRELPREGAQFIRLDAFPSGIDFSSIDLKMVEDAWWLHHLLSGTKRRAQYAAEFDDREGSSITSGVKDCGNKAFQLAKRIRNKYDLSMDEYKYKYMQDSLQDKLSAG